MDEHQRDDLIERFQLSHQEGGELSDDDEDDEDEDLDEDDVDEDLDEDDEEDLDGSKTSSSNASRRRGSSPRGATSRRGRRVRRGVCLCTSARATPRAAAPRARPRIRLVRLLRPGSRVLAALLCAAAGTAAVPAAAGASARSTRAATELGPLGVPVSAAPKAARHPLKGPRAHAAAGPTVTRALSSLLQLRADQPGDLQQGLRDLHRRQTLARAAVAARGAPSSARCSPTCRRSPPPACSPPRAWRPCS